MRLSSGLKLFQNITLSRYLWGLSFITVLICILFTASLSQFAFIKSTRSFLIDTASPILSLYQSLNHTADKVYDQGKDILMSQKQLQEQRDELEELRRWKNVALSLMSENKALRKQVNALPDDRPYPVLTARVLTYPSNVGGQRIIIEAGRKDGLVEGLPVITAAGLIGRIIETGKHSSEVLLITDSRSKIPVTLEPIHQQAILSGDYGKYLVLDHMENEIAVEPGMNVFTSGKGGNFPPGLFIGYTAENESKIVVLPSMNWSHLEYVQVIIHSDIGQGD